MYKYYTQLKDERELLTRIGSSSFLNDLELVEQILFIILKKWNRGGILLRSRVQRYIDE